MTSYATHRAKVTTIAGDIFISLPDDQYIKLTPEQARQMGARLFREAAHALGEPAPSMIIIRQEDQP